MPALSLLLFLPTLHASPPPAGGDAPPREQAAESSPASSLSGEAIWQKLGCVSCHQLGDKPATVGPSLVWGESFTLTNGATQVMDADYFRRSVREPMAEIREGFPPAMPAYSLSILPDEELEAMVSWLQGS